MGTMARGGEHSSAHLQTDVVIEHRPMMTHGLQGIVTKNVGPGRQVADKAYHTLELRQRLQDIDNEMQNMRDEITKIETDNTLQAQLARKYDNMLKDIRNKEGDLADFNLALDKVRTNIDAAELRDMFDRLRQRNEHERSAVDEVFMRAATAEKAVRETENRVSEFHDRLAQRVGSLGDDAQQEYSDLRDEEALHLRENAKKEQLLGDIDARIQAAHEDLASEAYQVHARGLQLQRLHASLTRQRTQLEEEFDSGATGEELYARLMRLLKESKSDAAALEVRVMELERGNARTQQEVEKREKDVVSAQNFQANSHKYESIFAKDKHIRDYINTFPESMAVEVATKERVQGTIVALLKHISSQVAAQETLPTDAAKLDELKADLSFKQMSQQQSEATITVVKKELVKRREELARIQGLDRKVEEELVELKNKKAEMQDGLGKFKSADELRREHAEKKALLTRQAVDFRRMRDALRLALQQTSQEFDTASRLLQANPQHKTLVALEAKLASLRKASHAIEESLAARRRESDYARLKEQSMATVEELNGMHKQAATAMHRKAY
jgi:intraflagellar transport protein 74